MSRSRKLSKISVIFWNFLDVWIVCLPPRHIILQWNAMHPMFLPKLSALTFDPISGFLLYCFTVLVFTLVMIYAVAPKYGRSNPIVYISICSLVGSVSVMSIKGFGVALKLTLSGNNQFSHPSTYVFAIVVAGCILVQMNYFNKALDNFSTNVYVVASMQIFVTHISHSVNPMYYVCFSTATLVASLILFQGLNTSDAATAISLLAGFVITFLGVHLLNISRVPEDMQNGVARTSLENGLMNPRLSVAGRASLDGWAGVGVGGGFLADGPSSSGSFSAGHGRRGSLYRHQSSTLFNAFEEDEVGAEGVESVGLHQLRELPGEEDEDEHDVDDDADDDADERTLLRTDERRERMRKEGLSSSDPSPRVSPRPG